MCVVGLTKKAEPPPTRDVNRDSGTDSANGGWLRRLVRLRETQLFFLFHQPPDDPLFFEPDEFGRGGL